MTTLSALKQVKIESELPANSNEVVTNAKATIRTINVLEADGSVKVFINLQTTDGKPFVDTITFKGSNLDGTLRYFSKHAGHIFKQFGGEYKTFTESFEATMAQLNKIKSEAKEFTMSTIRSSYNPEYVEVLYGDEQPQAS